MPSPTVSAVSSKKYQAQKTSRVTQSAQAHQSAAFALQQADQQELNRRRNLQQQTVQNINRNQSALGCPTEAAQKKL